MADMVGAMDCIIFNTARFLILSSTNSSSSHGLIVVCIAKTILGLRSSVRQLMGQTRTYRDRTDNIRVRTKLVCKRTKKHIFEIKG